MVRVEPRILSNEDARGKIGEMTDGWLINHWADEGINASRRLTLQEIINHPCRLFWHFEMRAMSSTVDGLNFCIGKAIPVFLGMTSRNKSVIRIVNYQYGPLEAV